MKVRKIKKNFWWILHGTSLYPYYPNIRGLFDFGMARIKHQLKDSPK